MAGNEPERARTGLKKGHSCAATVALSTFNCGSFAGLEWPNGKIGGLLRWSKAGFPFWPESFCGSIFVNIIHHVTA